MVVVCGCLSDWHVMVWLWTKHTGNGIGDNGAKIVGEVLKGNTTLKALFVEGLCICGNTWL